MTSRTDLKQIADDTIDRSEQIVASTPGGSLNAEFLRDADLQPLTRNDAAAPWPNLPAGLVQIVNSDSFTLARACVLATPALKGHTAVLNLASSGRPGGGWIFSLSKTQEEALCYSSTLYKTLRPELYPWPNKGPDSVAGIFSPGVVVFKADLDRGCAELAEAEREVFGVLTVAAPCAPALTDDRAAFRHRADLENLRAKVRFMLRMAARRGHTAVVLGAFGCGAYGCPPRQVASEMKAILSEQEFRGWFRQVAFAVYSKQNPGFVGADNFRIFSEVFDGVSV